MYWLRRIVEKTSVIFRRTLHSVDILKTIYIRSSKEFSYEAAQTPTKTAEQKKSLEL